MTKCVLIIYWHAENTRAC